MARAAVSSDLNGGGRKKVFTNAACSTIGLLRWIGATLQNAL